MTIKSNIKEHWQKYALSLVLIYGLFLRLLYLGKMPMWIDETISASAVKAITLHGYPLLDSGTTYFRAWIFSYLSAPFVWLFGIDIGSRFLSVIFGILTIYLAYLFGCKFISKKFGGLSFAILICFSTLEIIYSKQARFYQMFQFFYFLSFFLFYKFVILKEHFFKKRWMDYFSIFVSVYICINTQFMGYIILPLFVLTYVIYHYKQILANKKLLFILIFVFIIFLIYLFNNLNIVFFRNLVYSYSNKYLAFLFKRWIIVLFFVGGFVYGLFKNFKFTLSFGAYFIIPLIGLFFIESFATRYVYFALFGLLFYIAYFIDKLKLKWIILALFILLNLTMFDFDGIKMVNYDSSMPWADWEPAYDYISKNNLSLPIVSTWTPASYLYGNADYWIKYSIGGRSNETWMLSSDYQSEKYLNATLINSVNDFPSSFVLVLDSQASRKLAPSYHEFFKLNCLEVYSALRINVFECKIAVSES